MFTSRPNALRAAACASAWCIGSQSRCLGRRTGDVIGQRGDDADYYGAYGGGSGIGDRFLDESGATALAGGSKAVTRVVLIVEQQEVLRRWATAANWREATRRHKLAYFPRREDATQEAVLEKIRQHYQSCESSGTGRVQAALFRCDDAGAFADLCSTATVTTTPAIVDGIFDEKVERCIVDFANKRLGGAWLSYGMVQEEKLFIERPDLGALCARPLLDLPSRALDGSVASLFSMRKDEAWILKGAPKHAECDWYGRTPPDALERLVLLDPSADEASCPTVVAIDAIKASTFEVYERRHLQMMLRKAYVGFAAARDDVDLGGHAVISTGHWGCGAFGNNEMVMFVIQSLAANLAGVQLRYHLPEKALKMAPVDMSPAVAMLEDARRKGLTVDAMLGELAARCATDPEWRTKGKAHGPKGRRRETRGGRFPRDVWREGKEV